MPQFSHAGFVICGDHSGSEGEYNAANAISNVPAKDPKDYNQQIANFDASTCHLSDLFNLIALVINTAIALAGLYATIMIFIAGFKIVLGGTSGNEGLAKEGKSAITNAIIGLVIVLIAFVVIDTLFSVLAVNVGAAGTYSFPYNPISPSSTSTTTTAPTTTLPTPTNATNP